MTKVTLLDFSSGDINVTIYDKIHVAMRATDAETLVLSQPDDTPVVLKRDYAPGQHVTTVSQLRQEKQGWWGW